MWINLVTLTITITTTSIWIILVLDDCSPLFNKLNCYDIILQHWILMTLYCNIHLLWHYIATPSKITKFIFQCKRRTWLNSSDSSIFLTSWGLVGKNSYLEKSSNGYYIVKTGSAITIDSVQFWFPLYHDVYQIFNPLWCFREEVCTTSPTPVLPNL